MIQLSQHSDICGPHQFSIPRCSWHDIRQKRPPDMGQNWGTNGPARLSVLGTQFSIFSSIFWRLDFGYCGFWPILTIFDPFFPSKKLSQPSLWRARCWTFRPPPAVRHRSRWPCWIGVAWPPPAPDRPRWSASTLAHAASTKQKRVRTVRNPSSEVLPFMAISVHTEYCPLFSYTQSCTYNYVQI